ncbi:nucleotidyltransferase family protein [Devosia soli]|nr:nucleotidyltransferase family protein [Devosia soli]
MGLAQQQRVLIEMIADDAVLMDLLKTMEASALPDALLTSGAIYNMVWNVLTGRPKHFGVRDADVAYFDGSDLSFAAEDRVIRHVEARFAGSPISVQLRNQARVHLWFPQKFGIDYPQLRSSAEMLRYFTTNAYAVGARLKTGKIQILAPFGLDDLFSFRLRPNTVLPNRQTHDEKGKRAMACWPELQFEQWPL